MNETERLQALTDTLLQVDRRTRDPALLICVLLQGAGFTALFWPEPFGAELRHYGAALMLLAPALLLAGQLIARVQRRKVLERFGMRCLNCHKTPAYHEAKRAFRSRFCPHCQRKYDYPEMAQATAHKGISASLLPMAPLILCAGLWLQSPLALAADEEAASRPAPPASNNPIEEIEVTGQRSLQSLRVEILREEERMFDQFNALNSRREFDVHCGHRKVTGSNIRVWECMPVYMERARAQDAQDFLQFGLVQKSYEALWYENRDKHEALNAEMRALAVQHPEFGRTLLDLHEKKQRLAELEREQQRSGLNGLISRVLGADDEEN